MMIVEPEPDREIMSSASRCEPAVGIDLGTGYSSVGIFRNGKVEFTWTIPSYVAFTEYGCVVGEGAKHLAAIQYPNTEVVFGVKRLLGRGSGSLLEMQRFPFDVVDDKVHPSVKVKVKGKTRVLSSVQICSMILSKLKRAAESHLGQPVRDAVITVPAYFNFTQRQAVKDSATISGLNTIRVVSDAGAAGLAYEMGRMEHTEKNVLLFDLGAGGLNVAVMTLEEGIVEVKSVAGDPNIGGDELDDCMVTHFIQEINEKFGNDVVGKDKKAVSRLKTYCEKAKEALSRSQEATVVIDSLSKGVNFATQMTRARFEALNADLFRSTLDMVEKALRDAKIDKSKIDDIVLTGGSTHIPAIQKLLNEYFNQYGKRCKRADNLVVHGAAIYAALLYGDKSEEIQDILLLPVTPISLGIETDGGVMTTVIKRNKTFAKKETDIVTLNSSPQNEVVVKIFEGERALTMRNYLLGELKLANIPPGDREIEVTFDLDQNHILAVSAKDKITGRENMITVTNDRGRLSAKEIECMISEADEYSDKEGALETAPASNSSSSKGGK